MRPCPIRPARLLAIAILPMIITPGGAPTQDAPPARPTVVLLVRHAEKEKNQGDDPTLTDAGQARANALVHVAQEAGVTALYSTTLQRTRLTAEPLANSLGLPIHALPPGDVSGLVERLRTSHAGETVLVAGHSNTIPAILKALGADLDDIDEGDYDDLFVAHITGTRQITLTHLQYGVPTPANH